MISALMHASWNFISKSKTSSAAFFSVATSASVVAMSPLFVYFAPVYRQIPYTVWGMLLATGLCMSTYYICLASAYSIHDISFVYPITRSLPVLFVPIVCTLIGIGEPLRPLARIGMAVIVLGCLVLPLKSLKLSGLRHYWHPSILFAVFAALGTTGYTVIDSAAMGVLQGGEAKHPLLHSGLQSALFYVAFQNLVVALVTAAYVLLFKKEREHFLALKRGSLLPPVCSGIICAAAYALVLIAMQHTTNVSYITALRQISILIGVVMGVSWLKEKASPFKISGVFLVVTGLVMSAFK